MKRVYVLLSLSFVSLAALQSQIVINEIRASDGHVEIRNIGGSTVDISSYQLCSEGIYFVISSAVICGSLSLASGGLIQINTSYEGSPIFLNGVDGEMGLYINGTNFADPANLVDYVQWGSSNHLRESVAVAAGQWTDNTFVPSWNTCASIEYDGSGNAASDWTPQDIPTMPCGTNNNNGCTPMPLELLTFQAIQISNTAEIRWTAIHDPTATNVFLEHSVDQHRWETMTEWRPTGPEFDKGEYAHTNIKSGMHFYRLRTHYLDVSADYSPIVPLRIRHDVEKVTLWPNPATDQIEVFVQLVEPVDELEYHILDPQGRLLMALTGPQHITLDLAVFENGVYFIQIPAIPVVRRFIKSY